MRTNNFLYLSFNMVIIASLLGIPTSLPGVAQFMMGAIQFPRSVRTVPAIRIYSCGKKVSFQCDHEGKQLVFQVPQITKHTSFNVLITKKINFEKQGRTHRSGVNNNINNTIEYLKVPSEQPYLFYELTLSETKNKQDTNQDIKQDRIVSAWSIEAKELDSVTRKIPDETIIICYDPLYVDGLAGGSSFELPTIRLKTDLVTSIESERLLQQQSAQIFLSAIHSDTIHAAIAMRCQQRPHVTLIAPMA